MSGLGHVDAGLCCTLRAETATSPWHLVPAFSEMVPGERGKYRYFFLKNNLIIKIKNLEVGPHVCEVDLELSM